MRRCVRSLKPSMPFTLVELLVVVAIILLLVGILLPALKETKNTAHRIVCAGNLKQISLALLNYESDHGVLPYSMIASGFDPVYAGQLYTWTGRLYHAGCFGRIALEKSSSTWMYINADSLRVLRCPIYHRYGKSRNYSMNLEPPKEWGQVVDAGVSWRSFKVKYPSRVVEIGENEKMRGIEGLAFPLNGLDAGNNFQFPHTGLLRANWLFYDGHVEYVHARDVTSSVAVMERYRYKGQ